MEGVPQPDPWGTKPIAMVINHFSGGIWKTRVLNWSLFSGHVTFFEGNKGCFLKSLAVWEAYCLDDPLEVRIRG